MARRRRPRGTHPKRSDNSSQPRKLPEYLEAHEAEAIIRASDNPGAKLLMIEQQWRAGLRIAEAMALEVADLSLDAEPPTLRVRAGKGNRSRIVPMHRELQGALRSALSYGSIGQGRLVDVHPSTAWRWVRAAVRRAEELGRSYPAQDRHTHPAAQFEAPADERHPDQLPLALAGALLDPDDSHIPGAGAGPVGQS